MLFNLLGPQLLRHEPKSAVKVYEHYVKQFQDDVFALEQLSDAHLANADEKASEVAARKLLTILSAKNKPMTDEEQALIRKVEKRLNMK